MTSTTDTAGHPEVTELSDLTEGLLSPSRTADVRQHLEGCPLCADVYDSLEEIRAMLGTLPVPPRMPADIAGRIDAALAAEALPASTTSAPEDTDTTVPSDDASHPRSDEADGIRVSRETSAPVGRPSGHSRAATGPGRTPRKRRARRGAVVLGTLFTVAAVGLGTLLVQSLGSDTNEPGSAEHNAEAPSETFAGDTLRNQVDGLLTGGQKTEKVSPHKEDGFGAETNPPGSTSDGPSVLNTTDVPSCIAAGIGRSDKPLASKEGEYEGTDAYLVILPDPSDTGRVTAYVVAASCIGKNPAPPGEVLLRHSFARP